MIYFIYSRQTGQNYYPPWNRGPSHWLSRNYLVANCMWSSGSPVERSVPCTRPKPNTFPSTEIPSTLHGDLWPLNIFPIRRKKTSKLFQFQFQFYLNRFVSHRLTANIYFIFPFISITQWIRSGFYQEVRLFGRFRRSSFFTCFGRMHDGGAILCRPRVFRLRRFEPILKAPSIPTGSPS